MDDFTNEFVDSLWRVLGGHGIGWINNGKQDARCHCGYRPSLGEAWQKHIADSVIREFGIQVEFMSNPGGTILTRLDGKVLSDTRFMRRYVSKWKCDEPPVK